jgi:NAD+ diphosphatase
MTGMTSDESLWFLFLGEALCLCRDAQGELAVPQGIAHAEASGLLHRIGFYAGVPCLAAAVDRPPEGCEAVGLRAAFDILGRELYLLAGKGWQMVHWDAQSRFCAACGARTEVMSAIAKRCPACGKEIFPTIAPAVLVLIRKGEQALLVRARTFRGPHYGLVAGFLEVGETFEECVEREVLEETGLRIADVRYFGSQPWPYPSGLMVGFVARYVSGRIALLDNELSAAEFFSRDALPELPHKLSLARQMIDWWSTAVEQQETGLP